MTRQSDFSIYNRSTKSDYEKAPSVTLIRFTLMSDAHLSFHLCHSSCLCVHIPCLLRFWYISAATLQRHLQTSIHTVPIWANQCVVNKLFPLYCKRYYNNKEFVFASASKSLKTIRSFCFRAFIVEVILSPRRYQVFSSRASTRKSWRAKHFLNPLHLGDLSLVTDSSRCQLPKAEGFLLVWQTTCKEHYRLC